MDSFLTASWDRSPKGRWALADDIYSPESSDGRPDWPTLIVCLALLVGGAAGITAWWLL